MVESPNQWQEEFEGPKQRFVNHLRHHYGSVLKAWRLLLDRKETGQVSHADFAVACRKIGQAAEARVFWECLRPEGGTVPLKFHELEDEEALNVAEFAQVVFREFYLDWDRAWACIDPRNRTVVTEEEFVRGSRKLSFRGDAHLLFRGLEASGPGKKVTRKDFESLRTLSLAFIRGRHGPAAIDELAKWTSELGGVPVLLTSLGLVGGRHERGGIQSHHNDGERSMIHVGALAARLEALGFPGNALAAAAAAGKSSGGQMTVSAYSLRVLLAEDRVAGPQTPTSPTFSQKHKPRSTGTWRASMGLHRSSSDPTLLRGAHRSNSNPRLGGGSTRVAQRQRGLGGQSGMRSLSNSRIGGGDYFEGDGCRYHDDEGDTGCGTGHISPGMARSHGGSRAVSPRRPLSIRGSAGFNGPFGSSHGAVARGMVSLSSSASMGNSTGATAQANGGSVSGARSGAAGVARAISQSSSPGGRGSPGGNARGMGTSSSSTGRSGAGATARSMSSPSSCAGGGGGSASARGKGALASASGVWPTAPAVPSSSSRMRPGEGSDSSRSGSNTSRGVEAEGGMSARSGNEPAGSMSARRGHSHGGAQGLGPGFGPGKGAGLGPGKGLGSGPGSGNRLGVPGADGGIDAGTGGAHMARLDIRSIDDSTGGEGSTGGRTPRNSPRNSPRASPRNSPSVTPRSSPRGFKGSKHMLGLPSSPKNVKFDPNTKPSDSPRASSAPCNPRLAKRRHSAFVPGRLSAAQGAALDDRPSLSLEKRSSLLRSGSREPESGTKRSSLLRSGSRDPESGTAKKGAEPCPPKKGKGAPPPPPGKGKGKEGEDGKDGKDGTEEVTSEKGKGKGKGAPPPPGKGKGPGKGPPPAPGAPEKGKGKGKGKEPEAEPRKPDVKPGTQVKKLYWNSFRIDAKKAPGPGEGTVWDAIHKDGANIDTSELDDLFKDEPHATTLAPPTPNGSCCPASPRQMKKKIQVVDEKRRRQIGVMVARLPGIKEASQAVLEINMAKLNKDQVELLLMNSPSSEEVAMLRKSREEHSQDPEALWELAEEFIFALMDIPQFHLRLQVWDFENSFQERFDGTSKAVEAVQRGCTAMLTSDSIRHLLALVLYVGNYLNGGTVRGRADGFSIDTLIKMRAVKMSKMSNDNRQGTLVDYLVQQMEKAHPGEMESMLASGMEADNIKDAARPKLEDVSAELQKVRRYVQDMRSKVQASLQKDRDADKDVDTAFLQHQEILAMACVELEDLNMRLSRLHTKYQELRKWFHIEAKMNPEEFFGVWDQFMSDLRKARTNWQALIKRQNLEKQRSERQRSVSVNRTREGSILRRDRGCEPSLSPRGSRKFSEPGFSLQEFPQGRRSRLDVFVSDLRESRRDAHDNRRDSQESLVSARSSISIAPEDLELLSPPRNRAETVEGREGELTAARPPEVAPPPNQEPAPAAPAAQPEALPASQEAMPHSGQPTPAAAPAVQPELLPAPQEDGETAPAAAPAVQPEPLPAAQADGETALAAAATVRLEPLPVSREDAQHSEALSTEHAQESVQASPLETLYHRTSSVDHPKEFDALYHRTASAEHEEEHDTSAPNDKVKDADPPARTPSPRRTPRRKAFSEQDVENLVGSVTFLEDAQPEPSGIPKACPENSDAACSSTAPSKQESEKEEQRKKAGDAEEQEEEEEEEEEQSVADPELIRVRNSRKMTMLQLKIPQLVDNSVMPAASDSDESSEFTSSSESE